MEVGVEDFAVGAPPGGNVLARLALLREEQAKLRQVIQGWGHTRSAVIRVGNELRPISYARRRRCSWTTSGKRARSRSGTCARGRCAGICLPCSVCALFRPLHRDLTPVQPQPGHRTANTRIASYANPQRLHALAMPRRSAHPTLLRLPPPVVRAAMMKVYTRQVAAKCGPHLLLQAGVFGKQRNDRGGTLPSAVLCRWRSKLARGQEER